MGSTICLAMMAHNEAKYLPTIRASLGGRLSAVVILSDPPNKDGTMRAAKECFGHLPGIIKHRPWNDRADIVRNEVIDKARAFADYVLWLDPDSPLVGAIPGELDAPLYEIEHREAGTSWWITHLIRSDCDARFVGRIHEYLDHRNNHQAQLTTCHIEAQPRERRQRMVDQDIPFLLEDIADEPFNPRWPFYLAQSYKDTGQIDLAIEWYIKRSHMTGGFVEETYLSMYNAGKLSMGRDNAAAEYWLLKAYAYRPTRHEALVQLAWLYECSGDMHMASTIRSTLASIPASTDRLLVEARWC